MGKALVIAGVNFGTNKLDTVVFTDEVPCTAVSLDHDTLSLANLGTTSQLTATATPSDTTDSIVWSTSDIAIATVVDGLVTVTGAGTATITATCGEQTATCVVTTTHTLSFSYLLNAYCSPRDISTTTPPINKIVLANTSADANYGVLYQSEVLTHGIYQLSGKYPIRFGKASKLTFTAPNTIKVTVQITDSTRSPRDVQEYQAEAYTEGRALYLYSDASPWDSNVSLGNRVVNVPEGADSVVITLRKTTADLSSTDIANVTVVAS